MSSHLGEIAALCTALCWTITSLSFESACKRIGSLVVNFIRLALAFLFLSISGWIFRGSAFPTDAPAHAWIWLSLSGFVGFTIGDLCLFRAFVLIGARISMLLMALVPLFTALISWLIMNEQLDDRDLLGMALTVGGVIWVVMERRTDDKLEPEKSKWIGVLLGLGGAIGQAVGLVLSKFGMQDYDVIASNQIRVIAGTIGFLVLFIFIGWWPKVMVGVKNKSAMVGTGVGAVFGPFLGVSLSLVAVRYTQTGVAATIMALVPVMIIVPSILIFKERVTLRAIAGAVIAVFGSSLLFS